MLRFLRRGYFFGYGADSEPELITAITGHRPRVIGPALLQDYELRIQTLPEITEVGPNPRQILRKAWGDSFVSYVIVPAPGSVVRGTLFRLSLRDRHLVDAWELVDEGWYDKEFRYVTLASSGERYKAEIQVLGRGQSASQQVNGVSYTPWLISAGKLCAAAEALRA